MNEKLRNFDFGIGNNWIEKFDLDMNREFQFGLYSNDDSRIITELKVKT